jgi:CheY-like chemotaxis protein
MKILVVEDSQIVRTAYVAFLREHMHQVDSAPDGLQALAMAKNQYNVILMDIYLPHMNGIDITYRLRQQNNIGNPIIIGLTSDVDPNRHQMCLDAGMNEVLQKTISLEDIITTIHKYFV